MMTAPTTTTPPTCTHCGKTGSTLVKKARGVATITGPSGRAIAVATSLGDTRRCFYCGKTYTHPAPDGPGTGEQAPGDRV